MSPSVELLKSPIRIGNVSGATGDASDAMYRVVTKGHVDAITGDWLWKMNIAWNAIAMWHDPEKRYEEGFLSQLEDSIDIIASKGTKVVTNAGALHTTSLTAKVKQLCKARGHDNLITACVLGDDISHLACDRNSSNAHSSRHLDYRKCSVTTWKLEPYCGVAYIGAWGVVAALNAGADIVICGRVTGASPVIGLAAWWYDWKEDDLDQLAGALVAGRMYISRVSLASKSSLI